MCQTMNAHSANTASAAPIRVSRENDRSGGRSDGLGSDDVVDCRPLEVGRRLVDGGGLLSVQLVRPLVQAAAGLAPAHRRDEPEGSRLDRRRL